MRKVAVSPEKKRTHNVRLGVESEKAEVTTEALLIPPRERPVPKERPTQAPTAASRACESLVVSMKTSGSVARKTAASMAARETEPSAGCVSGANSPSLKVPARTLVVKAAKNMKMGTATKERGERRAQPHSPCPEVQPLASAVPSPVATPPAKRPSDGAGAASNAEGMTRTKKAPAARRPPRKAVLETAHERGWIREKRVGRDQQKHRRGKGTGHAPQKATRRRRCSSPCP
eukprot:scaffold3602_cov33-Tisochrysis_lutea.AAC.1